MSDELVRKEVKDARHLVRDLLDEAQQPELFTWADEGDRIDDAFLAINELALIMEAEIEPSEAGTVAQQHNTAQLKALIGRRYHINIKKTAWKAFIASIPIALNIFRAKMTLDPTAVIAAGGSFLGTIEIFRDSLQRLTPDEVVIYLAIKDLNRTSNIPPDAVAIAGYLNAKANKGEERSVPDIEQLVQKMVLKKILKEDGPGYRTVV